MTVLADFIETCRSLAVGERPVVEITSAMEQLVANPTELAAKIPQPPDGPDASVAGIDQILFEDHSVTVFLVHSRPGVVQPPHDHLISAVIGVYEGAEEQRYFRRDGDTVVPSGGATIEPGQVLTLGPSAIHAIAAVGSAWCRAVHVYLGPLSSIDRSLFDPVTFAEEPLTTDRYDHFCTTGPVT